MGYIRHHSIIVTGWRKEHVIEAHLKAREIFRKNIDVGGLTGKSGETVVSDIIEGLVNSQSSFFIAPDGSKEGWDTSDKCDDAREEFLDWLLKSDNYCDYVEVIFGGDGGHDLIIRSKEIDI